MLCKSKFGLLTEDMDAKSNFTNSYNSRKLKFNYLPSTNCFCNFSDKLQALLITFEFVLEAKEFIVSFRI